MTAPDIDQQIREVLELPEDAVIEHGVLLVSYINQDTGNIKIGWRLIGNEPERRIGLIYRLMGDVQHQILEREEAS